MTRRPTPLQKRCDKHVGVEHDGYHACMIAPALSYRRRCDAEVVTYELVAKPAVMILYVSDHGSAIPMRDASVEATVYPGNGRTNVQTCIGGQECARGLLMCTSFTVSRRSRNCGPSCLFRIPLSCRKKHSL
jgi:hypothetical protein